MKRMLLLPAIVIFQNFSMATEPIKYPETRKTDQTDEYFGTTVKDPYRWLEDDNSEETKEWVTQQNLITQDYLSKIEYRDKVKARLTKLWNFPKASSPFKSKNNYFIYSNNGLQNQFVLNILRGGYDAKREVFIDPNTLSSDGTVNLHSTATSHDGKLFSYAISRAGSDWQEIYIRNIEDGKQLSDKIEWVKFSNMSWRGNGFYYSRYEKPDVSNVKKGKNEFHKIYFHVSGTSQDKDKLVYEDKSHPNRNFSASVTDEEDYLIVVGSEGSNKNNLVVQDLKKADSPFVTLIDRFENNNTVIDNDGSGFYVLTDAQASNYKLVLIDANKPSGEWKEIIPESKDVLKEVVIANNIFIANYMKDATSILKMYSKEGKFLGEIALASIGTVGQLSSDEKDENVFFALTTFTSPSVIYRYNVASKSSSVYFRPEMDINSNDFETKEVFYKSKDGTMVPMFITSKKGIAKNGNIPTLVFGYGGFNISLTPEFKIERMVFLENGGLLAVPCLRGGGEYGEDWHSAGTQLKKQNVFDDCIAAAEYLIKEGYTNPSKLAVAGRSNGGLLVGAVITQRPDLFRVALPTVGVMDMLRYHKFTIGWAWKGDYGSSEDEAGFKNLLSYSPLHNIKENVEYPATLVATGDHDDRVVPAHSFKYISTLQEKNKGDRPQLIRIDVNSGHASASALGSSKPVSKQIEEQTDIFTFLLFNLGMTVK